MKTKIILLILVFALGLSVLSGCADRSPVVDDGTGATPIYNTISEYLQNVGFVRPEHDDKFYYWIYDTFVIIGKGLDCDEHVVVPATYNGLPVIGINSGAFTSKENIVCVTIGANVIWIGASAFAYCPNITTVIMAGKVNQIDSGAFASCTSLRSIIIPKGVSIIANGVFKGCESLKKVIIEPAPEASAATGKVIDGNAFDGCTQLAAIWIPSEIYEISGSAFAADIKPTIFSDERTIAALFAANRFLDFSVTKRENFDAAARRVAQNNVLAGASINESVISDGLKIELNKVDYYKKLGSVTADEGQLLVAFSFTIYNNNIVPSYLDGFGIACKSMCIDLQGELTSYTKCPVFVAPELFNGVGFPSGNVAGNDSIQGVVVLRVVENYDSVSIRFPDSLMPFIIKKGAKNEEQNQLTPQG